MMRSLPTVVVARRLRPRSLGKPAEFNTTLGIYVAVSDLLPSKSDQMAAVLPYANVLASQISQFGCPSGVNSYVADFQSMFNTTGLYATAADDGVGTLNTPIPLSGVYDLVTTGALSYVLGYTAPPPGCPSAAVAAQQAAAAGAAEAASSTSVSGEHAIQVQQQQLTQAQAQAAQAQAQAAQTSAQAAATTQTAMLITGGVVVAAGAAWYFLR